MAVVTRDAESPPVAGFDDGHADRRGSCHDDRMEQRNEGTRLGVSTIPGSGYVIRTGPLTLVIGSDEPIGRAALAAGDALASQDAWTFEAVAAALQELVVAYRPSGVAAVLDGGEAFAFVFDQAEVRAGAATHKGNGRSGWTVELLTEAPVELRLASVPFSSPSLGTVLRAGMVPGAGAILERLESTPSSAPAEPVRDPDPDATTRRRRTGATTCRRRTGGATARRRAPGLDRVRPTPGRSGSGGERLVPGSAAAAPRAPVQRPAASHDGGSRRAGDTTAAPTDGLAPGDDPGPSVDPALADDTRIRSDGTCRGTRRAGGFGLRRPLERCRHRRRAGFRRTTHRLGGRRRRPALAATAPSALERDARRVPARGTRPAAGTGVARTSAPTAGRAATAVAPRTTAVDRTAAVAGRRSPIRPTPEHSARRPAPSRHPAPAGVGPVRPEPGTAARTAALDRRPSSGCDPAARRRRSSTRPASRRSESGATSSPIVAAAGATAVDRVATAPTPSVLGSTATTGTTHPRGCSPCAPGRSASPAAAHALDGRATASGAGRRRARPTGVTPDAATPTAPGLTGPGPGRPQAVVSPGSKRRRPVRRPRPRRNVRGRR